MVDKSTYYQGNSTGILLIHGLGGTPVEMRYIAQGLHRAGYTVYCCQLHGHCGSTQELQNSTWKEWIGSVEDGLKKLSDCKTIFVSGLSAGSLLALYLAEKYPSKIDGAILYSPTLVLNGWAMPFFMKWLYYLRPSMLMFDMLLSERFPHGIKDERIRSMIVDSMKSNTADAGVFYTPLSTLVNFNALSSYVYKRLSNVTVPVLSFHPKKDDFADISNSHKIIRKVSGLAELVALDDCYHIITLDKQRDIVLQKTKSYIQTVLHFKQAETEKRILQYKARSAINSEYKK